MKMTTSLYVVLFSLLINPAFAGEIFSGEEAIKLLVGNTLEADYHKAGECGRNVFYEYYSEDGKIYPISLGWGCPCFVAKNKNLLAHDGYPLLGDTTMSAGETREFGYWFMLGEKAAIKFRTAGRFFLWEGWFVGEAIVL